MISSIQGVVEGSKVIFNTRHIIGYHDIVKDTDLDRWACLNIECDSTAKCYLTDIIKGYKHPTNMMSRGIWQVMIYDLTVITKIGSYLRKIITRVAIFEYWVNIKRE